MGGMNSGTWYRWDKKDTTAAYSAWDIESLIDDIESAPSKHYRGRFIYSTSGKETATVIFELNLRYTFKPVVYIQYQSAVTQQVINYCIYLAYTLPNYGGKRWWWLCPMQGCGRRVGKLYFSSKYHACRHCLNLVYESQQACVWTRRFKRFGCEFGNETSKPKRKKRRHGRNRKTV